MSDIDLKVKIFRQNGPRGVDKWPYLEYHLTGDNTGWRTVRLTPDQLQNLILEAQHVLEELNG